jgi:hypothetical protein
MRKILAASLVPSVILLLGLTIGALAQSLFAVGMGSQLVQEALLAPQFAANTDLIVTYRGSTGAPIISNVATLQSGSNTPPAITGTCTGVGTQLGGNTAGSFVATCSSQTAILTFGTTAPHGWLCIATDITTTSDTMKQSATSTTSCTLSGTTAASDVVAFEAIAF